MRTQYSAQYNLTIQRELTKDMKLEVGYVDRKGTGCWQRMTSITQTRRPASTSLTSRQPMPLTSRRGLEGGRRLVANSPRTLPFIFPEDRAAGSFTFALRAEQQCDPAGTTIGPNGITLVGLRPYSSPQCDPLTGIGCPINSTPVFTGIFAQDTIASSAYNSLQISLDKRFARGLQFTAAYTFQQVD